MSEHETRLVPMMKVCDPKTGKVLRYTHPYNVGAEQWWENGITEQEARPIAAIVKNNREAGGTYRAWAEPVARKLRTTFGDTQ